MEVVLALVPHRVTWTKYSIVPHKIKSCRTSIFEVGGATSRVGPLCSLSDHQDQSKGLRPVLEWTAEERCIQDALARLEQPTGELLLTAQRTLELANKAYSLYLTRHPHEQAQLLKMVLLNCAIDGASVHPTYRKPFDLIFQRAKTEPAWEGARFAHCFGTICISNLSIRSRGPRINE